MGPGQLQNVDIDITSPQLGPGIIPGVHGSHQASDIAEAPKAAAQTDLAEASTAASTTGTAEALTATTPNIVCMSPQPLVQNETDSIIPRNRSNGASFQAVTVQLSPEPGRVRVKLSPVYEGGSHTGLWTTGQVAPAMDEKPPTDADSLIGGTDAAAGIGRCPEAEAVAGVPVKTDIVGSPIMLQLADNGSLSQGPPLLDTQVHSTHLIPKSTSFTRIFPSRTNNNKSCTPVAQRLFC